MVIPSQNDPQVSRHYAIQWDKNFALYFLLAGVAGGLVLAALVTLCCKICFKKKKQFARQHVVFDRGPSRDFPRARKYHSLDSSVSMDIETGCGFPESSPSSRESKEIDPDQVIESGISQSWPPEALPDSIAESFGTDIELQLVTTSRTSARDACQAKTEEGSEASSPERPPEPTSAVRRRSSVGIQRQASVCLSDDEDQELGGLARKATVSKREVKKVCAVVHHSGNDKHYSHKRDQKSSVSQPSVSSRHPPFNHAHSSPDSRVFDIKKERIPSTFSLQGVSADTIARVVDLESYHYSRQQLWELASQGATLLKERSQSSIDIGSAEEGWSEVPPQIQQAESTEAGLLEQSLEQHQLENLRTLLRRYSPFEDDDDDDRSWCKVRYNDTGSREDIRDEVIEIISGESDDDSNSSIESEIGKQQYRKLWELRATLEEQELEEEQQGAIGGTGISEPEATKKEAEIIVPLAQPEEDCEPEPCSSQIASFESNVEATVSEEPEDDCEDDLCEYLQLPSHELRRHCYKSLLARRLQKRLPSDHRSSCGGGESSLESVESSSTDRTEGATTSFESTTDNTDSTGEGQTNRLQQMKADSGYKSIESNGKAPRLSRKQLQFALDADSLDVTSTVADSVEEGLSLDMSRDEGVEKDIPKTKSTTDTAKQTVLERGVSGVDISVIIETVPERKKSKSALKKHHTEGDSPWSSQPFPDTHESRSKPSVFQRLFRTGRLRVDPLQFYRDYSIDEKSDALFREFSRPDQDSEYYRSRGSRLHSHIRLHHRSLPPADSGSPRLARKVLSPQVSIEEESCESGEEHHIESEEKKGKPPQVAENVTTQENQAQIPVICLSQGRGERPN